MPRTRRTTMRRWQDYDVTNGVLKNFACNTASGKLLAHILLIAAIAF